MPSTTPRSSAGTVPEASRCSPLGSTRETDTASDLVQGAVERLQHGRELRRQGLGCRQVTRQSLQRVPVSKQAVNQPRVASDASGRLKKN
ncbi:hypothetical protein [Streptomyces sp. NPDC086147]|uniref:hypothetical protein n=1 Tax=unclassified Streptomyces TaxID=2593676 RepID=UPI00344BC029